ncbi:hypothetical protein PMI10_02454 [Flavobacterium sp. CF136]|nr:hypothetical protein PMI10_02454 [Flavobacterium sp. CF136]
MKVPEETIYFVATDFNPLKICDDKFKVATRCCKPTNLIFNVNLSQKYFWTNYFKYNDVKVPEERFIL